MDQEENTIEATLDVGTLQAELSALIAERDRLIRQARLEQLLKTNSQKIQTLRAKISLLDA